MPIFRYFAFVGGALLALLFAAERYQDLPAAADRASAAGVDKTVIRIHSARSLPEKIVFDTSVRQSGPTIAATEPAPEARKDRTPQAPAAMQAAKASVAAAEPVREHAEKRPRAKRIARITRRPPERRLAYEPHGFFDEW